MVAQSSGWDGQSRRRWNRRTVEILDARGSVVFSQTGVEAPCSWSDQAVRIAASKYFAGMPGSDERENSIRQLVGRVVETLVSWVASSGVEAEPDAFRHRLEALLLDQRMAFNSPVWFNVGVEAKPQCSACFINSVDDSLASILDLAKTEGLLFKHGSGSGSNLSSLRGCREPTSKGGTASGPLSFMRGLDAFAGAIKSGGRTRRAAKMVVLDCDHPDIEEFVVCKVLEERKAKALIAAGYDSSVDGEAYATVAFQNANHSVRLTDRFMDSVADDRPWQLVRRTDGRTERHLQARDLFRAIAAAAWESGDPGIQFADTIESWNTCKATAPIRASNPCSEFVFLDDTACNLASLNVLRFAGADGEFDSAAFSKAVEDTITAQEAMVSQASYPTEAIAERSERFRPLGLGYANLGAWLMSLGLAYDSDAARGHAAALTALLSGVAYRRSAELAAELGAFAGFRENRDSMLEVIERHRKALGRVQRAPEALLHRACSAWDEALDLGRRHGFRNAQVTAIAPTGTISFLMDCDTTGIEPDIALVKRKALVGGGEFCWTNTTVDRALQRLGYDENERTVIAETIAASGAAEGAPGLGAEHLPVFDCSLPAGPSRRAIAPSGHLAMVAAVQPFVSGAISKTVNLPEDASLDDVEAIFRSAYDSGVKAVAIYRDGSKGGQPLSASLSAPELCASCGGATRRSGNCFVCENCGETTACA